MNDKAAYARRKFKEVMIAVAISDTVAVGYVLFASVQWLIGDRQHIESELFGFVLEFLVFSIPFVVFLCAARTFVLGNLGRGR